jgi:hypothetical protein
MQIYAKKLLNMHKKMLNTQNVFITLKKHLFEFKIIFKKYFRMSNVTIYQRINNKWINRFTIKYYFTILANVN